MATKRPIRIGTRRNDRGSTAGDMDIRTLRYHLGHPQGVTRCIGQRQGHDRSRSAIRKRGSDHVDAGVVQLPMGTTSFVLLVHPRASWDALPSCWPCEKLHDKGIFLACFSGARVDLIAAWSHDLACFIPCTGEITSALGYMGRTQTLTKKGTGELEAYGPRPELVMTASVAQPIKTAYFVHDQINVSVSDVEWSPQRR
jgi:hypothetical protein